MDGAQHFQALGFPGPFLVFGLVAASTTSMFLEYCESSCASKGIGVLLASWARDLQNQAAEHFWELGFPSSCSCDLGVGVLGGEQVFA